MHSVGVCLEFGFVSLFSSEADFRLCFVSKGRFCF